MPGQEYCHKKWGLPYNLIIDLGQNGCSTSYASSNTLSRTRRHKTTCFLDGWSGDGIPDISDTLDTTVEETLNQINDEVAVDAAFDDLSVMTASGSEM